MRKNVFAGCFVLACVIILSACAGFQWQVYSLPVDADLSVSPEAAPLDNPLKGFMPYYDQDFNFPCSLEWFYVPMNAIMDGPSSFTFDSGIEPLLDDIAGRGHQAVFRVYLDYPDLETGIPAFILSDIATNTYTDYGGGISPDYDDEDLIGPVEDLIEELGRVYNGDPRIGFITIGILGFWGEWHTYPHDDWFASRDTQLRVITAMNDAFPDTEILLRYPGHKADGISTGYHDDSFAYETLPEEDWSFLQIMADSGEINAWKTKPIGGELYPDIQADIFNLLPPLNSENYTKCVEQTHASWLLNYEVFESFPSWSSAKQERAENGAAKLGYTISVKHIQIGNSGTGLSVACRFINTGVAPFYYRWPVTIKVLDAAGNTVAEKNADWDITTILPGDSGYDFSAEIEWDIPASGEYTLGISVDNPMEGGKPLVFANDESTRDGKTLMIDFTL